MLHGIVNRGPAKGCVWPVIAPAEGIVRAGDGLPGDAFLSRRFAFDHACCLPPERQTGRLAGGCVPIPPWVGIAGSAFSDRWCAYRISWVHFGLVRFFMAIPTENERDAENGVGGEAKCVLRDHIGFAVFSAGSTLGLRAPKPAPKSHWLSGLSSFGSRCGCVLRGEGDSRTTRACLAPINGGRAKWKRARPAARQQPPVQRRMCFFVTTVSGRKSRDFIYSVRL